jgi:hypothetical protein
VICRNSSSSSSSRRLPDLGQQICTELAWSTAAARSGIPLQPDCGWAPGIPTQNNSDAVERPHHPPGCSSSRLLCARYDASSSASWAPNPGSTWQHQQQQQQQQVDVQQQQQQVGVQQQQLCVVRSVCLSA